MEKEKIASQSGCICLAQAILQWHIDRWHRIFRIEFFVGDHARRSAKQDPIEKVLTNFHLSIWWSTFRHINPLQKKTILQPDLGYYISSDISLFISALNFLNSGKILIGLFWECLLNILYWKQDRDMRAWHIFLWLKGISTCW